MRNRKKWVRGLRAFGDLMRLIAFLKVLGHLIMG
jgi:hypothetical protein